MKKSPQYRMTSAQKARGKIVVDQEYWEAFLNREVMVNMEVWLQMVTSVGFPIAACAALWYYMVTLVKEHKEEVNTLRTALEANTIAIIELKELIKHERDRDTD